MKGFYLESFDKKSLFVREFSDIKEPKAVLLIVHGMSEHSGRYVDFAEFLKKNGIVVYAFDLRAHGKTDPDKVGIVTDDNFNNSVFDVEFLANYIKGKYPSLNLTIMGHSYGSFIMQKYIQKFKVYDKVILSGSSYMNTFLNKTALFIANMTACFKGKKARAKLIYKLSFGAYEKKFENKSWLSSDAEVTRIYKADPFCNKIFSVGFYKSFMKNSIKLYKKKNAAKIESAKPIYLFSGKCDPVGGFGKGVVKLDKFYAKQNLSISLKLYDKGQHEMINELEKNIVYDDFKQVIIG